MRASRLLQILLLLQNRGRMTCAALSGELEVARRTILRDVDALTEAGLPVIVHRGPQGGIELGFNYRTRLTGLAADEAEALPVMLSCSSPVLAELGMLEAARRAAAKIVEMLPDQVRQKVAESRQRFGVASTPSAVEPRIAALAEAIRGQQEVRIRARSADARLVHPLALVHDGDGWSLTDALKPDDPVLQAGWGDINISAKRFTPAQALPRGLPKRSSKP